MISRHEIVRGAWQRLTHFLWVSGTVIFWIVVTLKFAPALEAQFFPVLSNIRPVDISISNSGQVSFYIAQQKIRPCKLASVSWSAVQGDKRVPINVQNPTGEIAITGRPYVPPGYNVLGPYAATLPEDFSDTDKIEGLLYYDCHVGWLVEQIFGPVPISDKAQKKAAQGSKY